LGSFYDLKFSCKSAQLFIVTIPVFILVRLNSELSSVLDH
jgi:hypothetical protein